MSQAPYRVHRLIQDLNRDAGLAAEFAAAPEALFGRYAIEPEERELLRAGTPAALMRLGVHPNLQMKFLRLRRAPAAAGAGPLAGYLRDLGLGS